MSPMPTLDARLRSAALRLRLGRALDSAVLGASLGLLSLALSWLGHAGLPIYLPLALAALAAAIASLLRVPELPILSRLDRAHEL
ncbi:MAG TPA: hypothetical protein VJV78_00790, partial [Polyangiales bacterium]|nr:hypothetical protein [Polyangiales bacterium]